MGNKGKYRRRRQEQMASSSGAPSPPGSTSGISSVETSSSGAATPKLIRKNEVAKTTRSVSLVSNMSRIRFKDYNIKIYLYDIEMKSILTPEKELSRGEKLRVFEEIDSKYLKSRLVWDESKLLYGLSNTIEPIDEVVTIGKRIYHVKLKLTEWETSPAELINAIGTENMLPQNPLNALNVILSHCIKQQRNIVRAKSGFYRAPQPNRVEMLRPGIELWKGTRVGITPTDGFGITVRFIRKHQAFVEGDISLSDFIEANEFSLNNSQLRKEDRIELSSLLKGMKVTPIYAKYPRKLTISNVSTCDAYKRIPDREDSITTYLEREYDVFVSRPRLNCIELTNKNLIPIEFLKLLPNQPYYKNDDAKWQADILRKSCIRPQNFLNEITYAKKDLSHGLADFQSKLMATIANGFETTTGNVLPIERTEFCSNNDRIDIKIIGLNGCYKNVIDFFSQQLTASAQKINLRVTIEKIYNININDIRGKLSAYHHNLVIGRNLEYGRIKLLEKDGYHIQCVDFSTLTKMQKNRRMISNTMMNILLKLNIKAGGTNWSIPLQTIGDWRGTVFRESVMIVGADVTHFTDGKPSIAAVVCSSSNFDFTAGSSYNVKIAVQYPEGNKRSMEYIKDMKNIMKKLLCAFYKNTYEKPAKIIYYRDGVSMGQFENTVLKELQAIQDACTSLEERYEPKISLVVCTKRHDQRFIKEDGRNPDMGTVVSKNLVAPNYFNFYLFSQHVLQGTGVPCHYYVLYDDNKLGAYFWHNFTFLLCQLYARCQKAVSYPAPVYYAHLACYSTRIRFRAKYGHIKDWQGTNLPEESEIEKEIAPPDQNYMFYI